MITTNSFRKTALSLPGVEEHPHFDKPSFRVKKKIFATLWEKEKRAMLKLSLLSQSVYCSYNSEVFFPVPGGWGKQGATFVDLSKVKKKILEEALSQAYKELLASL